MDRLNIRKTIQKSGDGLYKSIPNGPLKWIVGEVMNLNEEYVLNNMNLASTDILKYGFTVNQLQWIKELKEMFDNGPRN